MTTSAATALAEDVPAKTLEAEMTALGHRAKAAAQRLARATTQAKNQALTAGAAALRAQQDDILAANAKDMAFGRDKGLTPALLDRLELTPARIEAMAQGLEEVAAQDDPVGRELARWTRPNGLDIARVMVPLGVIGIIYESRPNVTADAAAICLKSGNATILRGGSESFHSSAAILVALRQGLAAAGLPGDAVQTLPTRDRAAVGLLLKMHDSVDVIVPRGGRGLIERVMAESRIPIFAHLEGLCHTYIHTAADIDKARAIAVNAKMRRVSICGAMETLLIDRAIAKTALPAICNDLITAGCELRGDEETRAIEPRAKPVTEADWTTEYLAPILSIRVVDDLDQALAHIATYGSAHTEAIVTEDTQTAERFLKDCGSAIVMVNASTQYADGGEFGMGAEIGISTGRLHARGPVGVEQLTTMKYQVRCQGQVRP